MITSDTRKKIVTALLFAASALPLAALAGPTVSEHASARVSYRDLDISASEGIETLDRRLHRAANEVCGSVDFRKVGWSAARLNRQCAAQAVAKAWAKIQNSGIAAAS